MTDFERGVLTLLVIWGTMILLGYRKKAPSRTAHARPQSIPSAPRKQILEQAAA